MLYDILPLKLFYFVAVAVTVMLCAVLLKVFFNKLPKDHGREFAFNGSLSAGKVRGAGIVFICSFIICSFLFIPVSLEYVFYYVLLFFGMLSGYLDDRAEKPWGEYKKGAIDLLISVLTSINFVYFNKGLTNISLFGLKAKLPAVLFVIIGTVIVWMLINAVNCSDGIDGFSSTLSSVSLITAALIIINAKGDIKAAGMVALMIFTLIPYLWKNSEPSTMMMGDAGSRAIGLLLSIVMFKTGNILLIIPVCFMVCLDGLIGIAKVSMIRFLHINALKKIRTPLHDHFRKNKTWSNTQVIYRFSMIQIIISAITVIANK